MAGEGVISDSPLLELMLHAWIKLTLFPKEDQQFWINSTVRNQICKKPTWGSLRKRLCLIQPPEEQVVPEQNLKETFLLNHVSTKPSILKEERKSDRGTKPAHLSQWLPQLWIQRGRSKVSASFSPSVWRHEKPSRVMPPFAHACNIQQKCMTLSTHIHVHIWQFSNSLASMCHGPTPF